MPTFDISLVRSFIVTIEATTPEQAKRLAEFYIGYSDASSIEEQERFQFQIAEIEMTQNDAVEVLRIEESTTQ